MALCERVFGPRPGLLDAYGHPIHAKESLRYCLLLGDLQRALVFGERLQAALRANDPAVQVLLARHHAAAGDRDAARAAWQAALARDPGCAEARQWLARETRDAAAAAIGGPAELRFADCADLARFGAQTGDARLTLFAPLSPPDGPDLPDAAALPERVTREYCARDPAPGGIVHAVGDCVLTGAGVLVRGDRIVLPDDVLPDYLAIPLSRRPQELDGRRFGALGRPDCESLRLDAPVAVALHGQFIWGHFLFEMLPRLYLLSVLARMGRAFPLLMPTTAPDWARTIAAGMIGEARFIAHDPDRQCVAAPRFILPGMMQRDWLLHPAFNLMVADLHARFALQGPAEPARRIYLSRARVDTARRLLNEEAVERTLAGLGFAIVHPQQMRFAEQLRLWRGCDVVVGECNSALHGAVFAPATTRVVALNCFGSLQASIARTRGQRVWFVPPDDGVWRTPSDAGEARNFSIDCRRLRETVLRVLDGAPPRDGT